LKLNKDLEFELSAPVTMSQLMNKFCTVQE